MFAGNQLRQIFTLLLGRAVAADLVDAEIGMRAIAQAHGSGRARDFLERDAMFEIAKPRAAELFFDGDAVQADSAHFRPEVARKLVCAVDLGGAWRDLVLRKITRGRADHLGGFAQIEVEGRGYVGDHGICPKTRPGTSRRRSKNSAP
jgi:hypothetical protein